MLLKSLSLYGVGRHAGPVLTDLAPGLTVVFGLNEAGKSTVLAGLRGMLFGRVAAAELAASPERGASGLLVAVAEDGTEYQVERGLYRKSPPKITDPSNVTSAGQDVLKACFPELASVEDVIYQSVFSFQLAELTDFADIDPRLPGRFYLPATGGVSPAEMEQQLYAAAKELYNPDRRARNAALLRCLQELDELREQLRQRRDTVDEYRQAEQALAAARAEHQRITASQQQIAAEIQEKRRFLRALPVHRELLGDREALRRYEDDPVLSDADVEELTALDQQIAQADGECERIGGELERTEQALADVRPNEEQADQLRLLEELHLQASGVLQQERQCQERRADVAELERRTADLRAQLSGWWREEVIARIATGDAVFQEISGWRSQIQQAHRLVEQAEAELAIQRRTVNGKRVEFAERCQESLGEQCSEDDLRARQAEAAAMLERLADDEQRLYELERVVDLKLRAQAAEEVLAAETARLVQPQRRPQAGQWLAVAVCGLALLATVLGISTHAAWEVVAAAGVTAAAAAAYWVLTRRTGTEEARGGSELAAKLREAQIESAQTARKQAELENQFVTVRPVRSDAAGYEAVRTELRTLKRTWNSRREELDRLLQLAAAVREAEQDQRQQNAFCEDLRAQEEELLRSWQAWLEGHGIDNAAVSPDAFETELRIVREIRQAVKQRDELVAALSTAEQQVAEFVALIRQALVRFPDVYPATLDETAATLHGPALADAGLHVHIDRLRKALESAQQQNELRRQRAALHKRVQELRQQLDTAGKRHDELAAARQARYTALGIASAAQFAELLARRAERSALEQAIREKQRELAGIFGSLEAYEQAAVQLTEFDEAALRAALERLEVREQERQRDLDDAWRRVVEAETRLQTWQDGSAATDLLWRLSAKEAEKRRLAFRWAVATVAAELVREARTAYEQERTPKLFALAGQWLTRITDGKYVAIRHRTMDRLPVLYCADVDGREWPVTALSRGTREQVYLALRLAVIRDYADQGIRLPVVLDDPFVNFDDDRLHATLELIAAFSGDVQCIYLTCHRQVVEWAAARSDVGVRYL